MMTTDGPPPGMHSAACTLSSQTIELTALGAVEYLRRSGVGEGDRVVIDVRDPLQQFTVMLAVAHLGATAVTHDHDLPIADVDHWFGSPPTVRDADRARPGDLDPRIVLATPLTQGALDLERWVDLSEALLHLGGPVNTGRTRTSGARLFRRVAAIERQVVVPTVPRYVLAAVDPARPAGFAALLILVNRDHGVVLPTIDGQLPPNIDEGSEPLVIGTTQRLRSMNRLLVERWPDAIVHDVEVDEPVGPGGRTRAPEPRRAGPDVPHWAEVGRLLRIVRDDPATYSSALDRLAELSSYPAGRIA